MNDHVPFIGPDEAARLLDHGVLVERLRDAFLAPPIAPSRLAVPLDDGDSTMLVMPVARPGGLAGVKLVTVHPALSDRPEGAVRALCVAIEAATGAPLAIIDGNSVTHRRTAATSVLAARALARADADSILVVGAGHVAQALCECYSALMAPRRLLVWARRPDAAAALTWRLAGQGIAAAPVADLRAAVREADIVSAATLARQPLILGADVRPGTHVDLVGGFTPAMREADDDLIGKAVLVADGIGALDTAGDLAGPIERGVVDRRDIRLLADVLADPRRGRRDAEDITLFKSVGHALEDLAAMELIVEGMLPARRG